MKKQKTILVVDSSKSDAQNLIKFLRNEGFLVLWSSDAQSATSTIISKSIDLIILELNLTGKDGYFVIENVRSITNKLPIIIVSYKANVESKIMAISSGANDYLTKPYNNYELLARIKNQFRYFDTEEDNLFNNGYFTIDYKANNIYINGKDVHFTHFEFKLLTMLASNINKTVSTEDLINKIWGKDGNNVNGLRVFVAGIRNKIKKEVGNSDIIRTDVGVGYRMISID